MAYGTVLIGLKLVARAASRNELNRRWRRRRLTAIVAHVPGAGYPAGRNRGAEEGSPAYTSPDHHGTPLERASVITDGIDLAATVDKLDVAFAARRF